MAILEEQEYLRQLLCLLQDRIRDAVCAARDADQNQELAGVAATTQADIIYKIDRISEAIISTWFAQHWPNEHPIEVVMEGLEEDQLLTFPTGTPVSETKWKCILDPIDGTRNLMYDKRSAWVLGGISPQKGAQTQLQDISIAAMTELPTTRAWRSDQLSVVRGQPMVAVAHDMRTGKDDPYVPRPSNAGDCRHAFASITRFFAEGLTLMSTLEEQLWARLYTPDPSGSPLVFTDQYISTGGQLFEILSGRDRFIADLRPLAFRKLGIEDKLSAHPYDLATIAVAEAGGVIIEDPLTHQPLVAPLDTTTAVAWVAYANSEIAGHIRPVLTELIQELFL